MKKIKVSTFLFGAALSALCGCNIDPEYHKEVDPNTFFDSPEKVYMRLTPAYIHYTYNEAEGIERTDWARLQEFVTDEIFMPTRDGGHWGDGGIYLDMYGHNFSPVTTYGLNGAWEAVGQGVAKTWSVKEDIARFADFNKLFPNNPDSVRKSIYAQCDVLVAACYLRGLDFFGGMPICRDNKRPQGARATSLELFNYIDSLLISARPNLLKKAELGALSTGNVDQAIAASLRARLYFNAEAYIGQNRYAECAMICDSIIRGDFGPYALASDFTKIFGWGNETSDETIWNVPSSKTRRSVEAGNYDWSTHYNQRVAFGNMKLGAPQNGFCLTPSLSHDSMSLNALDIYDSNIDGCKGKSTTTYRLGSPFSKFHKDDVRKKQYVYTGGGTYKGMFLVGPQLSANGDSCRCSQTYPGELVSYVDQNASLYNKRVGKNEGGMLIKIGRYRTDKEGKNLRVYIDTIYYKADKPVNDGFRYAEENSGVRLLKFQPVPTEAEDYLRFDPDVPLIRLSEIYYMLAECKLRAGDKGGAAQLINQVKTRYFPGITPGEWEVQPGDLDDTGYRMLDEWMVEFLGEKRRRTDLVRWGKFHSEAWFDHTPKGDPNYNRYPVPIEARNANLLLDQNPGYGY
ncbi:MAG: RagB/SusD family nutrient uptake outer membrane protein [Rikenellaceae bacterium]|jgi:hypothetical protein|nr:RagB/SusD family nutrient uptake outer membrane protein [Rikenellaceae bacterium]